uniref:Uncharacterized protein n=1 Tax=Siphoviridae sp. ctjfQ5 TaxID=2823594 RepID=A0A8S5L8Z5_9CAUD|nr:MAG TPA: hypothetical protein [Siphoviridae sp. ctjfQ5]
MNVSMFQKLKKPVTVRVSAETLVKHWPIH